MNFNELELELDSRQEMISILGEYPGEPEMSEYESGILTALIKYKKPKKIVEIGVASGYTSSIILNQLVKNKNDFQMFSIDLNENFYRDSRKKTGFFIEQTIKKLNLDARKHKLYTGKYAVEHVDKINKGIDFLILDTVHSLPGEIYDFLAFLPLLNPNAIIVLHDTNLHHLYPASAFPSEKYSNLVLFGGAVGNKLIEYLDSNVFNFSANSSFVKYSSKFKTTSNIGAIEINQDTIKYVENVFQLLMLNWAYLPSETEFNYYFEHLSKHYDNNLMSLFKISYETNKLNFSMRETRTLKYKPFSLLGIYLFPIRILSIAKALLFSLKERGLIGTLNRVKNKISKHAQ